MREKHNRMQAEGGNNHLLQNQSTTRTKGISLHAPVSQAGVGESVHIGILALDVIFGVYITSHLAKPTGKKCSRASGCYVRRPYAYNVEMVQVLDWTFGGGDDAGGLFMSRFHTLLPDYRTHLSLVISPI